MTARLTCTVPEAAATIGISERTMYKLIATGEFPVLRIRRRTLISLAELSRWVETHGASR